MNLNNFTGINDMKVKLALLSERFRINPQSLSIHPEQLSLDADPSFMNDRLFRIVAKGSRMFAQPLRMLT